MPPPPPLDRFPPLMLAWLEARRAWADGRPQPDRSDMDPLLTASSVFLDVPRRFGIPIPPAEAEADAEADAEAVESEANDDRECGAEAVALEAALVLPLALCRLCK